MAAAITKQEWQRLWQHTFFCKYDLSSGSGFAIFSRKPILTLIFAIIYIFVKSDFSQICDLHKR